MADMNLIAQVYPYEDNQHLYAQTAIEHSSRYMPPKLPRQQQEVLQSRGSRESTEPPEEDDHSNTLPYLEVRFSDAPRTSSGLVFGTDENICDVVLPRIQGISRRHFALTYKNTFTDGCPRLIVRDLGSTFGTAVTYGDQGNMLRSKFDWILDGFDFPNNTEEFIVHLCKSLKLRIVVARHNIKSPAYANNVERFRQGTANPQDLLRGLGLPSGPETERNSGAQTPVKRPILLQQGRIGYGGFGVVSRHWNVSTGEEYACKRPIAARYDREGWRNEINIMRKISNNHIVRLCFFKTTPLPRLYLEYMPFGNLEDQHEIAPLSYEECVVILHQSTSAVRYLHGQPEPITHRDIKPANILVQHRDPSRNPDALCIKLSDFGLAKIGDSLKTGCHSETYCPPEISDRTRPRYTRAVDIWSLGVVILRFAYALPHPGSGIGMAWCEKIVKEANSWESEGLVDILQRMLVIDAKARYSAADCWHEASQLVPPSQSRSATPTPASHAAGYGATAAHLPPVEQGREEQEPFEHFLSQAIVGVLDDGSFAGLDWPSPSLDDDLDDDPDSFPGSQRYNRSDGPPPTSVRLPSATSRETSSRSSGRYTKRAQSTSRHLKSGSEVDLYQDCWLDPLHPLGGGSSLAIGGRPSRGQSPSSEIPMACNLSKLVDGQDSELEPWDWEGPTGSHMPRNEADHNQQTATGGDDLARGPGEKGAVQDSWTDSERYMAAALLGLTQTRKPDPSYATCDDDRLEPPLVVEEEHAESSRLAEEGPADLILPDEQDKVTVRRRKKTSPQDKDVLEAAYLREPRPDKHARFDIVQRVSMNDHQVQIWFQNRRQADRRQRK